MPTTDHRGRLGTPVRVPILIVAGGDSEGRVGQERYANTGREEGNPAAFSVRTTAAGQALEVWLNTRLKRASPAAAVLSVGLHPIADLDVVPNKMVE